MNKNSSVKRHLSPIKLLGFIMFLSGSVLGQDNTCTKPIIDSLCVQLNGRSANIDSHGNIIFLPEDGSLYGAINCSVYEKAVTYTWPISQTVVYGPKNYTVNEKFKILYSFLDIEKDLVVIDKNTMTITIYKPKTISYEN